MSTNDDQQQQDFDDDDGPEVVIPRKQIRHLEKLANRGKQAETELAQLKRELTFRDAGINPNDARMKYFVKGYDGETSVEAIKAAAVEAGFLHEDDGDGAPPPAAQQQAAPVGGVDLSALQRANALTATPQAPPANLDAAFATALQAAQAQGPDAVMEVVTKFGMPVPGIE